MLQVKGPDIGDGDDFNGSNKNFGLRPSLQIKKHEEENEIEPNYEYHEGMYDGFKSLTIEEAISIIEKEGVFV